MSTEKNCNDMGFFEVAYELARQSEEVRHLTERLREAIERGAALQTEIESRAPELMVHADLVPGRYDFHGVVIELDDDGDCFVETHEKEELKAMSSLPGYQAWSDEIARRQALKSA